MGAQQLNHLDATRRRERIPEECPAFFKRTHGHRRYAAAWRGDRRACDVPARDTTNSGAGRAEDCIVKLWNPATGELVDGIAKLRNQVKSVALSPDDRFIVSGQEDGSLPLWNLGDGTLNATCSAHSESVVSLALTMNGDALVSGCSNGEVRTWELPTLRTIDTLREADGPVRSVACWGDSWVAAGGHRMDGRTQVGDARLWNLATGSAGPAITGWGEVPTMTCGGWWEVDAVVISPDGRTLATAVGNAVRH